MTRSLRRTLASLLHAAAKRLDSTQDHPPFAPGELDGLLSHLAYELLMFEYTQSEWKTTRRPPVLEAFLLHARNLRDFLFDIIGSQRRDADKALLAVHYAVGWDAQKGRHEYKVLWETEQAINAQLAHLSRKRIDPKATVALDQRAEEIGAAIQKAWASFYKALEATPWSSQLNAALAAKRSELGLFVTSSRPKHH